MFRKFSLFQNKKILCLLCVELFLVLVGVIGLFKGSNVVWRMQEISELEQETISLPAGVYTLRVYYTANEETQDNFGVALKNPVYYTLLSNPISFRKGISQANCQFYLTHKTDDLQVFLNISEKTDVWGAEIIVGPESSEIFLFWILLISLTLNAMLWFWIYNRQKPFSREKKFVIAAILFFVMTASIPLLVDYHCIGADLGYHLLRIEALAVNIRRGELGTRISSLWLAGHGYASSVFYGDTLLVLPALLRVLGFSMDFSYRFFLLAVNIATAIISYISFSKCTNNRLIGTLGCALYTLAPYRLYNMYNRSAVGEFAAMIFLPLIVWGIYRIYTKDSTEKRNAWDWIIPVIGFSGVIQSHLLSCEMVGFYAVLFGLILWKKTFSRRVFPTLCKIVGMTVLLNAWFLVPLLDMMTADQYLYGENAKMLIQRRGLYLAHIFYTLQEAGYTSLFHENGMKGTEPIGLGAALLICMGVWLYMRMKGRKENYTFEERKIYAAGDYGFFIMAIALFMSTRYFPWDYISVHCRPAAIFVGALQFPTRITTVVTILGVFVACLMGKLVLNRSPLTFLTGKEILILIMFVAVLFGNFQVDSVLLSRSGVLRLYSIENMGNQSVFGAEYLPVGASLEHMTYHAPVLGDESVILENYQKDGLEAQADVSSEVQSYVEFPLLYYKGYRAEALGTGKELSVVKGDNGDVRLLLPEGFHEKVRVWYAGMSYWHIAEFVSAAAGILMAVSLVIKGRKGKKKV